MALRIVGAACAMVGGFLLYLPVLVWGLAARAIDRLRVRWQHWRYHHVVDTLDDRVSLSSEDESVVISSSNEDEEQN